MRESTEGAELGRTAVNRQVVKFNTTIFLFRQKIVARLIVLKFSMLIFINMELYMVILSIQL